MCYLSLLIWPQKPFVLCQVWFKFSISHSRSRAPRNNARICMWMSYITLIWMSIWGCLQAEKKQLPWDLLSFTLKFSFLWGNLSRSLWKCYKNKRKKKKVWIIRSQTYTLTPNHENRSARVLMKLWHLAFYHHITTTKKKITKLYFPTGDFHFSSVY